MARDPVIIDLKRSEQEAKRLGVPVSQTHELYELIKGQHFPKDVRGFDLKFERNSAGEPAVWVIFLVKDQDVSDSKFRLLNEFGEQIRSKIFESDLPYWPYIQFRAA